MPGTLRWSLHSQCLPSVSLKHQDEAEKMAEKYMQNFSEDHKSQWKHKALKNPNFINVLFIYHRINPLMVYNLMGFLHIYIFTELWLSPQSILEHFHPLQKKSWTSQPEFPLCSPHLPSQPWLPLIYVPSLCVHRLWTFHLNRTIQYMVLWDRLLHWACFQGSSTP